MRLFKFLVISNEIMQQHLIQILRITNDLQILETKNKFYEYRHGVDLELGLKSEEESDGDIVFMSIDYPNEVVNFANNNKAYIVINSGYIEKVMKLISPLDKKNKPKTKKTKQEKKQSKERETFGGCTIKYCHTCTEVLNTCSNKNISIKHNKPFVRGRTWSFTNDSVGTKHNVIEDLNGSKIARKIEPKTGGIVYSSIQWKGGERPPEYNKKTVAVPLQHWIKCNSIPEKTDNKDDYSFYHKGHIFDYRNEFIKLATKGQQETLRKETEPENNIRRGRRVLAGQEYFAHTLKCNCGFSESKPKCRDCPGVLYIDTEQRLKDLYNSLRSDEYEQLS